MLFSQRNPEVDFLNRKARERMDKSRTDKPTQPERPTQPAPRPSEPAPAPSPQPQDEPTDPGVPVGPGRTGKP